MTKRTEMLDRVLNAASKEELSEVYGEWADAYDNDLINKMGYVAHERAVNLLLGKLNDPGMRILDAGCGTGLVGEAMYHRGFQNLDGLDYSKDMLAKAGTKGVYSTLLQADLTTRLDLDENIYDAVISVGTFTLGHVGPDSLLELIRITRPSGLICFTVRQEAWEREAYQSHTSKLEEKGLWSLVGRQKSDNIRQEGSLCTISLYRVCN